MKRRHSSVFVWQGDFDLVAVQVNDFSKRDYSLLLFNLVELCRAIMTFLIIIILVKIVDLSLTTDSF
jgi:hypothetical protein